MDGAVTYGTVGRVVSALAVVSAFIGALQASGFVQLLPQRYAWVGLVVTALGLLIAGFSERIQGGASNPQVRIAAQQADNKNALEQTNQIER